MIDQNPDADTVRVDDYPIVNVARAREQLAARAEALREAEQKMQAVKGVVGGEPVFEATRVPVRMITTMKQQGASTAEIVEGCPSVTARMVELAEIRAAAHPARGRPKKLSEQGLKVKSVERLPLAKAGSRKASGTAS